MFEATIARMPKSRAARSPAKPPTYSAAITASIASAPSPKVPYACARKPVMIPVRVSPAPAVPNPALPVEFTKTRPSGAAISERVPFKTRITSYEVANSRAAATLSSSADLSLVPSKRSISPGCGVKTIG